MKITIHRDGRNFGPYTLEQANAMLASGQLAGSDLAWAEGAPDWTPLSRVPGVIEIPPPRARALAVDDGSSDRLILPAFLLAFFLGVFGVHRFYVGKTGSAIAMLVLTLTVVGAIVTVIWHIVDWVMIVCGSFTDGEGRRLLRWV
jgi:TM2 domain-containing membrane protein YozV